MNRYQIYLNPSSVEVIERLARELDVSRSQIIRDLLDRAAGEYKRLLQVAYKARNKNNLLLKMAGFAKSPTGKVAENIDEIYIRD